jgi:hypothetical protein
MTHIVDDELLAYLDGELPDKRRTEVELHVGTCSRCTVALETLDSSARQLAAALEWIDSPAPEVELAAIFDGESRGKRRLARGALFRAAALLLMIAGASAAAIPGSPVRDWAARSLDDVRMWFGRDTVPASGQAPPIQDVSGVAVTAFNDQVRISLLDPAPDALVRVILVDGDEGSVRATGARYRTGPGWIEVVGPGSEEIRIELPRSVSAARVEVNGELALVKEGIDLRLVMPAADTMGSEIVFRVNR